MNIPKYLELFRNEITRLGYRKNTIDNYVGCIDVFLRYFDGKQTEPAKVNEQQIKDYLATYTQHNTQRSNHSAIKCFYKYTIKQPNKFKYIEYCKKSQKLPIVLSQQEIQRMFDVCQNLKHKVILSLLYSCGLRVSELINLKWEHIDRSRMIINIINAKGGKDRAVMLDEALVPTLINYYRAYLSQVYVLNGQKLPQYSDRSVLEVVKQLAKAAGISKRTYTHLIRHCNATHLLEAGTDINLIQKLLGHSNVKTTMIYTHISHNHISKIQSPLSAIKM